MAALTRLARAPLWGQVLGMLAGLLLALTWLFPSGEELLAILPTPGTFAHFGDLLAGSVQDMRSYGVEVPDTDPLLFIAVLGVGAVAVLVDVLAVGLRRPALAGLPMLAIYSVPVAVYVDSVPAMPFVVGAAGYLWLLVTDNVDRVRRFGRRFTGDGRDVDVWEASPLAAAGRRLAAVGVALAVVLPLAVPGMTGGLLDSLSRGPGNGTGNGGRLGRHVGSDRPVRLARRPAQPVRRWPTWSRSPPSEPSPFYLRYAVADELRPDGFPGAQPQRPAGQPGPARPGRAGPARGAADHLPGHRRGHQEPEHVADAGVRRADPHRRPQRQLALRPQPAGRLLQPGELPGQEVLLRLRPLDLHARRRCGRAAAAGRPPGAPADDRHPRRCPRSRTWSRG